MRPSRFIQKTRTPYRRKVGFSFLPSLLFLLLAGGDWSAPAHQDQYEPPPLPVNPTPLVDLITAKERADLQREAANPKKLVDIYLLIADDLPASDKQRVSDAMTAATGDCGAG